MKSIDINRTLSAGGCWKMVNRIQLGGTRAEIRKRADVAMQWLDANEVITADEYNDLMMTVSYLVRETFR